MQIIGRVGKLIESQNTQWEMIRKENNILEKGLEKIENERNLGSAWKLFISHHQWKRILMIRFLRSKAEYRITIQSLQDPDLLKTLICWVFSLCIIGCSQIVFKLDPSIRLEASVLLQCHHTQKEPMRKEVVVPGTHEIIAPRPRGKVEEETNAESYPRWVFFFFSVCLRFAPFLCSFLQNLFLVGALLCSSSSVFSSSLLKSPLEICSCSLEESSSSLVWCSSRDSFLFLFLSPPSCYNQPCHLFLFILFSSAFECSFFSEILVYFSRCHSQHFIQHSAQASG